MAKLAFLLLFGAFWTALTAVAVLAALRSPPHWSSEPLWDAFKSNVATALLALIVMVIVGLSARLSTWDGRIPSGPSDLDRLLQVKRAGLWQVRYRALSQQPPQHAAPATAAEPPPVPTTALTAGQPPQESALDRLVSLKRRRGWYPMAEAPEE